MEETRSSTRWRLPLLGGLLLVMGSGVVYGRMESPPAQRAEAPVEPSEPRPMPLPTPLPDAGVPDAGSEGVVATPPNPQPPSIKPKSSTPAAPESMLKGTVELRIWPYATVFVDDKRMGDTPLKPLELAAGGHVLKFVNAKLSKTVRREIDLKPGQHQVIRIDLSEE